MAFSRRRRPEPVKGVMSGVVAGLAAAWMMNVFQSGWTKASESLRQRGTQQQQHQDGQQESERASDEDATMKAADRLTRIVTGHGLTSGEKKKAGPLVHYAFGATMGGLYGLASEYAPSLRAGFGLLFGTALFAVADEIAVPALRLSQSATKSPLSSHAYALASHIVYGAGTEAVRKGIRAVA